MLSVPDRLAHMTTALKENGLRMTPQRLAILRILAESSGHPSVESIYEQVKADFPTTSLATVYKSIGMLKSLGEVLELGFADSASRFDGKRPKPHPHAICTKCGAIADAADIGLTDMAEAVAEETGFRITNHRLDFFGFCPACQTSADND